MSASKKEHIEMILVDSKRDMIQVIMPPFLVSKFKEHLATGCSYIMHNFKVSNNDFSFKSTTHRKIESNVLVDILGGVIKISQTQINADNNKSKVVFSITDDRSEVQCTLWGQLAIQFHDYYKSHKEDGNIVVLLINAIIKEAQGGFPLNISNAWNDTKLLINDVTIDEAKNLSLAEITTLQRETTCVTVATLDKFEVGQSGWYYDGCVDRTKIVSLYKLEVLVVDGKYKAKFIFWDKDCVKLIGKSALQMKNELIEVGEDDPLEFPYALDAILKQELAIRDIFQPNKGRLYVVSCKIDEDFRKRVRWSFRSEEPTSKLLPTEPSSQDEPISLTLIKDIKKGK
ncbi:unnamed protein product [Vicia faba]|uniref:Uncharacterized protein n=1 Tax=Vicia faba TaxID=3906 RepID=A0AAV1AE25_VICFA|nr:unnamed protein product [Vicia faba]